MKRCTSVVYREGDRVNRSTQPAWEVIGELLILMSVNSKEQF